ncbi:BTAD domain-containing putative transcriptional regulator [Micromonospora sp. NPDC049559]|uniref:AfsR/SARP family transcriptional regulator n=1 Tax=Micromonospora sp. NPDC049559 TaxID=3155923 RepID=UPI00342D89A3
MRFGVLGPLAVWTDDGTRVPIPEAKVRALLADLLTQPGRPVPADRLIDDLWGTRPPRNPTATLHTRISQLRRALDTAEPGARHLVVRQPPGYLLAIDPDTVDATRFRALLDQARDTGDPHTRATLLTDALRLWRGPAYADHADHDFARPVAARLDEEHVTAQEHEAQARLDLGEHHLLPGELADLVARHPLCERLHAAHLRALYQAGRQSEALTAYTRLRERLAEELGVDPGPELTALHRAILHQDPALRAVTAPTAPPHPNPPPTGHAPAPAPAATGGNLPAAVTPLIGRAEALTRVRDLLTTARLLTLVGPGGVGKTALALAAARDPHPAPTDGTWLVDLADLDPGTTTADTVAAHIAATLHPTGTDAHPPSGAGEHRPHPTTGGPDPTSGTSGALRRLGHALTHRHPLLLLDNCEHVIEPVAAVAEHLLHTAPGLRFLATSQEPLAITAEHLWAVPPLPTPDPTAPPPAVDTVPAVQLFVARATAAAPGFRLGPDTAVAVATICRRLDGLPLALELAAARVRTLGVTELAARLDDPFAVLTTGRRGGPVRQRTLRATLDWSWRLLAPPEQTLLRRLATTGDGRHTLASAEHAAAGEVHDVPHTLARLVDRCLVTMTDGPDGPRYRLTETVRAYGRHRLTEATATHPRAAAAPGGR